MALLDHGMLADDRERRLAHLMLSMIGAGYVWQDGDDAVPRVRWTYVYVCVSVAGRGRSRAQGEMDVCLRVYTCV